MLRAARRNSEESSDDAVKPGRGRGALRIQSGKLCALSPRASSMYARRGAAGSVGQTSGCGAKNERTRSRRSFLLSAPSARTVSSNGGAMSGCRPRLASSPVRSPATVAANAKPAQKRSEISMADSHTIRAVPVQPAGRARQYTHSQPVHVPAPVPVPVQTPPSCSMCSTRPCSSRFARGASLLLSWEGLAGSPECKRNRSFAFGP